MALIAIVTNAGRAALVNAANTGTARPALVTIAIRAMVPPVFMDALPRNPTGKVLKRELRLKKQAAGDVRRS